MFYIWGEAAGGTRATELELAPRSHVSTGMLDERTNESCFEVGWADDLRLVGWLFVGGLFLHKHACPCRVGQIV